MSKQFLDLDGLRLFNTQLFSKIDQRFASKLATSIGSDSTNDTFPGTKAVYDFITGALTDTQGIEFVTVVGPITSVAEPKSNVIYLQKDDAFDTTWEMYVYVVDEWVGIGSTEVDLSGYWAKEDLEPISADEIQDIIDEIL